MTEEQARQKCQEERNRLEYQGMTTFPIHDTESSRYVLHYSLGSAADHLIFEYEPETAKEII